MKQLNNMNRTYRELRMDELEWIAYRKKLARNRVQQSEKRMRDIYDRLTKKNEIPDDKWGKVAYWLSNGGNILSGIRMGLKVGAAINMFLKLKQRFTRRKA